MNASTSTRRTPSLFSLVRYGIVRAWFEPCWGATLLARTWERRCLRREMALQKRIARDDPADPGARQARNRAAFLEHELSLFPAEIRAHRIVRLKRLRIAHGLDTSTPQEGA